MKESSLERRFVTGVNRAGAEAWKFVSPGRSGVPDRIVLVPQGKIIFVELKTETGKLSPLQVQTHNRLREMGFDVRTLYGKQYVEGFIYELQSMGLSKARRRMDPRTPQLRSVFGDGSGENSDNAYRGTITVTGL